MKITQLFLATAVIYGFTSCDNHDHAHGHSDSKGHSHGEESGHNHKGESAHAHEGETAHAPEGETAHAHEGETAHAHEGDGEHAHEGETAHAHDGDGEHAHEGETAHAHEGEDEHKHEGETAHAHDGEHGHSHEGEHGHSHGPAIQHGPNGGRLLTSIKPHAEFLVKADRTVQITFVDDTKKAIPATTQQISVMANRKNPTTLNFAKQGDVFVSDVSLPAGNEFPVIVMLRGADGETGSAKFNCNLAKCPTCDSLEYACTCDHH